MQIFKQRAVNGGLRAKCNHPRYTVFECIGDDRPCRRFSTATPKNTNIIKCLFDSDKLFLVAF